MAMEEIKFRRPTRITVGDLVDQIVKLASEKLNQNFMDKITLHKPGSRIAFKKDFLNAKGIIITAAINSNGGTLYEIGWYDGYTYKNSWIPEEMFEVEDGNQISIGFKK